MLYNVYSTYDYGRKYLGCVEAESEEEARSKAKSLYGAPIELRED